MVTVTKETTQKVFHFLKDHWGEIYTIFDVVKGALGKGTSADEGAPPEIKLVAGLFGTGDEINFTRTMMGLPEADQEILAGLIEYHFGPLSSPRSWVKATIAFAQMNKWRTMVTGLDSESTKVGTKKVSSSSKTDGADSVSITTEEDLYRGEKAHTRKFLKRIVTVIREGEDKTGNREDGYQAAIAYMRTLGMPLMPKKETMDWIESMVPDSFDSLKQAGQSVSNWIDQQAADNRCRDTAQPWLVRLIDKLIS